MNIKIMLTLCINMQILYKYITNDIFIYMYKYMDGLGDVYN